MLVREAPEKEKPFCFTIRHRKSWWAPVFLRANDETEFQSWLSMLKVRPETKFKKTNEKKKQKKHRASSVLTDTHPNPFVTCRMFAIDFLWILARHH
jgi:hypothetical protein